jgi:predicted metal-dependent hydrolase
MLEECNESPPPLLRQGIEEFNRGEYFRQHETLETLWRAERRAVRRLYQGILQIGVALYHLERRNYHGTVTLLARGVASLRAFAPRCQGVEVAALVAAAERVRAVVERLGPARLDEFDWTLAPRVALTERPSD